MFVPVQFAPPAPGSLLATPSPSGCTFLGRPRFFGCVVVVVVVVVADFPNSPSRPFPGASDPTPDPTPALAAAAAAAADLSCFAEPVRARLGAVGTTPLGPMTLDPGSASEAVPESSNPPPFLPPPTPPLRFPPFLPPGANPAALAL